MSLSFLRALKPFAVPADADASLRAAKAGGAGGLVQAALSAWGALALYLGRDEFLSRYAAGLPTDADPAVAATAQGMGPTIVAMAIGFQLVFAAVLAFAAWVQFRRGGWVPLVFFAGLALLDLGTLVFALLQGVSSSAGLWLSIRFLLTVLVLVWTAAALRAFMHSRSQPTAP